MCPYYAMERAFPPDRYEDRAMPANGNTCVIKPPSINSGIGLKLAEIFAKVADLPPGVVNVVTGPGGTIGQHLSSHPGVDLISFTGSCEVGKAIMAASSKTVKVSAWSWEARTLRSFWKMRTWCPLPESLPK